MRIASPCIQLNPVGHLYDLMPKKCKNIFQETLKFDLHIATVLQLLGDEVHQTPYRGFAPGLHWDPLTQLPPLVYTTNTTLVTHTLTMRQS